MRVNNSIQIYRNAFVSDDLLQNQPISFAPNASKASAQPATALTIGSFDGVHKGHQLLLANVVMAAHKHQLCPSAMTFSPHPREYFATIGKRLELAPTRISTLRDKVCALSNAGIKRVYLQNFNQDFSHLSAEDFIEKLLIQGLNTRWLLVGQDFRFGFKRQGDINLLRQAAQEFGFELHTIDDVVDHQNRRYSSSELRQALSHADLSLAQEYLGKHYAISGHVIHGKKLGRTIGFPTLNIKVMPRCALRSGIYIVSVDGLEGKTLAGIASLGVRPTVEDSGQVLLEVYLIDKKVSAYGKLLTVNFLQHVRDEEKFSDLTSLTDAISNDTRIAREYFASHGL